MAHVAVAVKLSLPHVAPVLGDASVSLNPWRDDDWRLLLAAAQDAEIVRWTMIEADLDDVSARRLLAQWFYARDRGHSLQWRLAATDAGSADVGSVSVSIRDLDDAGAADIAYWVLASGRRRGLARRAVDLVAAWTFATTSAERMALLTMPGNVASEAVARRCGFIPVGTRPWTIRGEPVQLQRWTRERGA